MCDVIDRIENRGIDKGVDKLALLLEKLLAQNRFDDVKKISKDKEYRIQLLKQFALI